MRRFLALVVVLCALSFAPRANAQLHWDAQAGVGVMHRFWADSFGTHQPGFGPSAEVAAHLALLPLIRVGGYFGGDVSPWSVTSTASRNATRTTEYGGVEGLVFVPVFPRAMKGWVHVGVGYGSLYERSYHTGSPSAPPASTLAKNPDDPNGYLEVPVGLSVSYTFWKPWAVYADFTGRVLAAGSGDAFGGPRDRWAVGLSAGIQVEL